MLFSSHLRWRPARRRRGECPYSISPFASLVFESLANSASSAQSVHLSLLCDTSATDPNPTLLSYTGGRLELEWKTPDACALSANPGGGGLGLWSFLKFMFWFGIVGLIGYLILGSLYNQQQYGARGWDLVPHRDFWRELPTLVADLGGHLFQNVRTSTGRGGYSSLG